MSTNQFQAGRRPIELVWPNDDTMKVGEMNCVSLIMVDMDDSMSWVRSEFLDGSNALVNPAHLAMILFED